MSVKENDWIAVEYEGFLDDGSLFDTSKGKDPLKFKVGSKMVISGFEEGVLGMNVDEEKTIDIPFEKAYGPKNTEVTSLPKELLSQIGNLEEGKEITVMSGVGPLVIFVSKIEETTIEATLNHPLAGKNLKFKVKLLKILSEEEIKEHEKQMHSCSGNCSGCGEGCSDDFEE